MFKVNWFRRDTNGDFVWPGFGQNMRVLQWIIERCEGTANAVRTPIGLVPTYDDINWDQSDFTKAQFELVTSQDKDAWIKELESHAELLTSWVSVCQQHSKHIMPNLKLTLSRHKCHQWQFPYKKAENQFSAFYMSNR